MDSQRRERLWRAVTALVADAGISWIEGVCRACVTLVPVIDGAAITLRTRSESQELFAATNEWTAQLEEAQYVVGEGPGVDAFATGSPVLVADLVTESGRWLAFTQEALSAGTGAVFAFPLQIGGIRLGTLDLYRHRPGSLAPEELTDTVLLAELATASLLDHAAEAGNPDRAARSGNDGGTRGLPPSHEAYEDVHIATGMLAAQLGISLTDAFVRLRAHAFTEARGLRSVARDVLDRRIRLDQLAD